MLALQTLAAGSKHESINSSVFLSMLLLYFSDYKSFLGLFLVLFFYGTVLLSGPFVIKLRHYGQQDYELLYAGCDLVWFLPLCQSSRLGLIFICFLMVLGHGGAYLTRSPFLFARLGGLGLGSKNFVHSFDKVSFSFGPTLVRGFFLFLSHSAYSGHFSSASSLGTITNAVYFLKNPAPLFPRKVMPLFFR
jgi:hypothetical protein